MDAKTELNHIIIYESSQADAAETVLHHFEKELPEHIARWLRIHKEVSLENKNEAEKQLADL
jgi:septum formation topological specificity factor MinE